VVLFINFDGLE